MNPLRSEAVQHRRYFQDSIHCEEGLWDYPVGSILPWHFNCHVAVQQLCLGILAKDRTIRN